MVAGRPRLGAFLIERQVITPQPLELAMRHQVTSGCRLGQALISLGFCSDTNIARALAEQLEVPFVDLEEDPPAADCIALLSREVVLEYHVLPIRRERDRLVVAALDPYDIRIDDVIRQATGLNPALCMVPEAQLVEQLRRHYGASQLELSQPSEVDGLEEFESDLPGPLSVQELIDAGKQVSTIRLVNTLLADAVRRGASDLHIEPAEDGIRVRCRIDGSMCPTVTLAREQLYSVMARIKIMCGLDIAESRKPQDGACRVRIDGRNTEVRVSTLCGIHGEIAVLRLLSQSGTLHQLDAIGFDPEMLRKFRRLLARRHGVLLITGPTGSGKTTTLYAALNHLNREDINILTVEDPVEVKLPGINQIQVHDRAGRSFAHTLRSMLRQDPDVIMVGEIRDAETADIACRAALTGHLVLSTLHTQHALGTVARLLDMGVAPWMVGACLSGVLAQRLVRRVCEECAQDYTPPPAVLQALRSQFGTLEGARFRKGSGCETCHHTGHRGRVGVFEMLTVDERVRELLARRGTPGQLRDHVTQTGFTYMEHDAFRKACSGLIAPEELIRLGFGIALSLEESEYAVEVPAADILGLPLHR